MRGILVSLAVAVMLASGAPVLAHHSHGNYFQNQPINLSGTVTEVHWVNPHVWIYMEVTDAQGRKQIWPLEGTGISGLVAKGWRPDSIKPQDRISVRCFPLKDGDPACLLGFITSINGVAMDKEFN
jgi:hypothetical protein